MGCGLGWRHPDGSVGQCTTNYGADEIPESHFHQGDWVFYGADEIPGGAAGDRYIDDAYGQDAIVHSLIPHLRSQNNVLLYQEMQRLTGTLESGPASAKPSIKKPWLAFPVARVPSHLASFGKITLKFNGHSAKLRSHPRRQQPFLHAA